DNSENGILPEFIYSYKDSENKLKYISFYKNLEFKNNSELVLSKFNLSDIWKNHLMVDYSKPLDDILKDIYKKSNYKVIWSAN
ncbi:TcpJ, partial [Clostridium perfringens]|nr:TcpJ [Clostridium perfringens]